MNELTTNEHTIITGLISLAALFLVMWILTKRKRDQQSKNIADLEIGLAIEKERNESKSNQNTELKGEIEQQKSLYEDQLKITETGKIQIAKLNTSLDEERKLTQEKMSLLENAEKNMTTAFENLSNRILEEKSKKFTDQNKVNMSETLSPLREQLGDFKKKIEDVYDKETSGRTSLLNEITNLKSLNQQMSKDAINLTKALEGESKTRGNWGEMILQRVLEDSGLKNGREYEAQKSYRDEQGNLFQPDVVVHLPDNKDVIIDSKVSLNAYVKYSSSESNEEKRRALTEHLKSIRKHVDDLQSKNYDGLVNINSPGIVLMFVPNEPALMLAVEKDENLFSDAFKLGIILVSPSTLNMNLQIIHNMWRNEHQNKNVQEIAKRAGVMYDKFVGFVETLEEIGKKLDSAQSAYMTAHKRLTSGKGNLVGKAEGIRNLGLKTNKELDKALVDKQSDDAETLGISDNSE